jgi:hypothetical protein
MKLLLHLQSLRQPAPKKEREQEKTMSAGAGERGFVLQNHHPADHPKAA